jgi:hypothetical protein
MEITAGKLLGGTYAFVALGLGIVGGLVGLLIVFSSIIAGLGMLLAAAIGIAAGVLAFPTTRRLLDEKANISISGGATATLVGGLSTVSFFVWTGFLVVGLLAAGGGDTAEQQSIETNHSMDEPFEVGTGDKTAEYEVTEVDTGQASGFEEADGMYVAVEMAITNVGDESFEVRSDQFTLLNSADQSYTVDSEATVYVDDGLAFGEQVDPGLESTGVVVFDVPEETDTFRLKIEPAGVVSGADAHFVDLGEIEA